MVAPASRRRTLRLAGYALFTLVAYVFFLWWLLPYPEIARNAQTHLLAQGISARILGLGPGTFPGVRARSVTLSPADAGEGGLELTCPASLSRRSSRKSHWPAGRPVNWMPSWILRPPCNREEEPSSGSRA